MTTPSETDRTICRRINLGGASLHALAEPWRHVLAPLGDRLSGQGSFLGWVPLVHINGVEISADGCDLRKGEKFWLEIANAPRLNERKLAREHWSQQSVFVTGSLSDFAVEKKVVGVVAHSGADISPEGVIVSFRVDDGLLFRTQDRQLLLYPSDESPSAISFTASDEEIGRRTDRAHITWTE